MDIRSLIQKRTVQVVWLAIILVIIFGVEWLWLTPEGQRALKPLDSASFATVNELNPIIASRSITVSGSAVFPGWIELEGSDQPYRQSFAGLNNKFIFPNVRLYEGWNSLTLQPTAAMFGLEVPLSYEMRSIWVAKSDPPTPILIATPTIVNQPRLIINGEAELGSRVVVTAVNTTSPRDYQVYGARYATYAGEEYIFPGNGRFHEIFELKEPGIYSLTVQSRNNAGYSSPPSQPITITYDPAWTPREIISSTRVVTATVEFKRFHYDVAITLPNGDSRLAALAAGQSSIYSFLANEFGGLRINQAQIEWVFPGDSLQFERSNKTTTIRASSRLQPFQTYQLPVWGGDFQIGNLQKFPTRADDHLVLVVQDYTIKSLSSTPSNRNNQTVVWNGDRDDIDPMNGIKVSLALAPNAASMFRILARLEPDDLIPSASSVTGTLSGLLIALPMIWVLWLLEKNRESNWLEERITQPFARMTRLLIIVAITGFVYESPDFWETEPWLRYLPLGGLAFSAIVAHLIARKRGIRALDFWRQTLFFGVRDAFLTCLAINALILIPVFLPALTTLRYQTLAALIVAPFILIALWIVLPFFSLWFENLPKWKWLIGALGVALSFPIVLAQYDVTLYIKEFVSGQSATVAVYVSSFLVLVRNAAPIVFLLGIILLLREATLKAKLAQPVVLGIGLVLFATYLVGTTLLWLDVPIAFLISLWMFPNVVLRPIEQQRATESVMPQILTEREKFLILAISAAESISFAEALERLENKIITGDLTPEEFEKRKQSIETYIVQHEKENMLANGVKARDVVLDIGPLAENWENGIWAAKAGFVLSVPILVLYLPNLFQENPYPELSLLITLMSFFTKWLVAAFFFGYYFPYLRGTTGLKKGLTLALAMIGSFLPAWLLSQTEPLVILFQIAEFLLFFAMIGLLAFDYQIFRKSLPGRFRWRKFLLLEGVPGVTALTSIVVASFGVAVNSIVTGQFTAILGGIVASSFPQWQQLPQLLTQIAERSQTLPK